LVQSETAFPRKCGFCTHRFVSRQDRIDHIADHFKQGKCMLDWNDDEDDNNDSDNADDDDYDHKHDSDSSNDTGGSSSGPPSKQAPSGANGRGNNNGDGFSGAYFGGYSQFQLSRDNASNQGDPSSIIKQHIKPVTADNTSSSSEEPREERAINNQCAIQGGFSGHDETAQSDESTLAGDVVARLITDGDALEVSTSQKGDGTKNGSLQLHTPHSQSLNTHVDGTSGRVATSVKASASLIVEGTSDMLLLLLYPDILGRFYVTHELEVWQIHCLSHFSGSTANGAICRIKDEQENGRRSFTRLKLEPRGHSRILTPRGTLTAIVDCGSVSANMDSTIFSGHRLLAVLADLLHTSASSASPRLETFLQDIRHCHFRLAAKDWHTLADVHKLSGIEIFALEVSYFHNSSYRDPANTSQHNELIEKLDDLCTVFLALGRDDATNTTERTLSTSPDIPSSESNMLNRSDNLTTSGLSLELNGLSPAASVFQVDAPLAMTHDSDQVLEKPLCAQPKSTSDHPWHPIDEDKIAKLWNIGLEDYGMAETTLIYNNIEQLSSNDELPQLADPLPRDDGAPALDFQLQAQSFLSVKLLGTGGFSTVDEVVHRETSLRICRKTLKNRDRSAVGELKKEVSVLQKLRHPHIIRFLGAYSKGDKVSILLSPVAETTLAVWLDKCLIEKHGGLTDTVVKMFGCLVSSVRYLHEQRPVVKHMDIKPQNILVMYGDSDMPHVILSDFGISSSEDTNEGQSLKPLTRKYVAPETSSRNLRERSADIWSLGCVFLEMLTVGLSESNPLWLDFREEFSGREAMYYWQEVPRLHEWLSSCLGQATSHTEATALSTVKLMLNNEPAERPDAVMLTMIFSPAPCCVSWPNDKTSYPGPVEELAKVESLLQTEDTDCLSRLHACKSSNHESELEPFACAKHWLQECSLEHEACHRQEYNGKQLPTRLVDIRPDETGGPLVRVVNSADLKLCSDAINYVAVSHAWSSSELTLSTDSLSSMQTAIPRKSLSTSVNNALSAATRIGHRYVWIDSLCVIQDSDEDKKHECESMASTFRDAVLTIVTLDACNRHAFQTMQGTNMVTPVVNPIKWQTPGFAWDTRAWTLQERLLSSRTLYLAGPQMYWECSTLKASETFPHGLPSLVWEKVHNSTSHSPSSPPVSTQRLRTLTPSPYDHQRKRFAIKSGRNGSTSTHDKDSFKCGFCPGAGEDARLKHYSRSHMPCSSTHNPKASANLPRLPSVIDVTNRIRARRHRMTISKLRDHKDMDIDNKNHSVKRELDIQRSSAEHVCSDQARMDVDNEGLV
jgi:serine/threonine protein kinase